MATEKLKPNYMTQGLHLRLKRVILGMFLGLGKEKRKLSSSSGEFTKFMS